MIRFALALVLVLGASNAGAVEPGEQLTDPALESRARQISAELRCLVCQNQSIDDSDAPLARDLRLLVREQLQAGSSDGEIREFLVSRYGEFVLLKPRFSPGTLLLWLTPLVVLAIGGIVATAHLRSAGPKSTVPLTDDEEQTLSRILTGDASAESGVGAVKLSKN